MIGFLLPFRVPSVQGVDWEESRVIDGEAQLPHVLLDLLNMQSTSQ